MQVNITKRIDTPEGKRYCPVVIGPNGRIKPDSVMVDGRQEKHSEGAYYLDWTEDGKRTRVLIISLGFWHQDNSRYSGPYQERNSV